MAAAVSSSVAGTIASIARQVITGRPLTRGQAEWLVSLGPDHLDDRLRAASAVREHFFGNRVRCCSIAAARVGRCPEDCAFCSQSAHYRTHVRPARLESDEIIHAARQAARNGARCFALVTSGRGPTDAEIEEWADTFARIRALGTVSVGASLGVLNGRQALRLAALGVCHYNHNLQTSRRHYPNIVSTHTYDQRLETLRHVRAAGMSLCCGALFGMGETWTDRLDLAFELRDLDPQVVPINFLIPIDGTPLARAAPLDPAECLDMIAIYRLLLPRTEIKVAGGREAVLGQSQRRIFDAGATGFLIGNYLTTCGQAPDADRRMLEDLGLQLEPIEPRGTPRVAGGHEALKPEPQCQLPPAAPTAGGLPRENPRHAS